MIRELIAHIRLYFFARKVARQMDQLSGIIRALKDIHEDINNYQD